MQTLVDINGLSMEVVRTWYSIHIPNMRLKLFFKESLECMCYQLLLFYFLIDNKIMNA